MFNLFTHKMPFQKNIRLGLIAIGITALIATGCGKPAESAYQKQVPVPAAQWAYAFQPEFTFDIPDTTASYKVYLIFRYDAAFEFSNIWLRSWVKQPGDSVYSEGKRIETVLLAADGSRLGNNVGGVYEYKVQLKAGQDYAPFTKPGQYGVKLEQIMRKNPLVGLINVGLRIERYDAKKPVS